MGGGEPIGVAQQALVGGSGGGEPIGVAQQALVGGSGGSEPIGVAQQALVGGSGGGEPIGVAQQALVGCCCPATVGEGKPVKCHEVTDASQCSKYEQYFDGACTSTPPKEKPICSVSGAVGAGGYGVVASVEGFALFFALAFCAIMRRRLT